MILFFIVVFFFCYLIGSIPVGLIIGKIFKKKDLSSLGSKNIGTSNAVRVLGFKYGLIIFVLDFLKGIISISLGYYFLIKMLDIRNFINIIKKEEIRIYFGIAAILGQMFSIFNRFKGGKGIATSVGVIFCINPWIGIFGILSFVCLVRIFGYAFLASLISTLLVNLFLWIFFYFNLQPYYPIFLEDILVIFLLTLLIFGKHYNNIIKWFNEKENKLFT
ncbi:hypothetical protein DH96_01245 [Candidatus Phytoplasma oryzae]|uniref:Glycerol-3-phosphate acyltransferase n=1 Tax=Candidatus Phytoplasma oryzae TaxID=203274 RepID=A0A328IKX3_9MOLU|nr:hypothetical protein DH96_01245 [Candidatus Phytoplasma oryzae]